jgi:hypothetical protein
MQEVGGVPNMVWARTILELYKEETEGWEVRAGWAGLYSALTSFILEGKKKIKHQNQPMSRDAFWQCGEGRGWEQVTVTQLPGIAYRLLSHFDTTEQIQKAYPYTRNKAAL